MKRKSFILLACLALPALAPAQFMIPEGTTIIWPSAYWYNPSLTNVVIPDSVTNVGEMAFYSCTNLTRIRVGKGANTIGDYAFACGGHTSHAFSVCFDGSAPTNISPLAFYDPTHMGDLPNNATVYAGPGTTGWSNTLAGMPVLYAQIGRDSKWLQLNNGQAVVTVWGNSNMANAPIVLEASSDFVNWQRQTNTMRFPMTPPPTLPMYCGFSFPATNAAFFRLNYWP